MWHYIWLLLTVFFVFDLTSLSASTGTPSLLESTICFGFDAFSFPPCDCPKRSFELRMVGLYGVIVCVVTDSMSAFRAFFRDKLTCAISYSSGSESKSYSSLSSPFSSVFLKKRENLLNYELKWKKNYLHCCTNFF